VWNDGAAFRDLRQKQREIENRRRAIEEEKKHLTKQRPGKPKRKGEGNPPALAPLPSCLLLLVWTPFCLLLLKSAHHAPRRAW
jgi:hypothetical protein